MNTDTTIAKNIRVADEKASYDAACKRLLSEKIILAWIMKNCLEEYRDCDVDEIAEKYIEGTPQIGEVAVAPDESNRVSMIQGTGNLEEDFHIKMTLALEREVSLMCNLSKGIEEKGIEKGIQKGLDRGITAMILTLKELQISSDPHKMDV